MVSPGLVRLPASFFDGRRDSAIYALRILLATVGGMPQLPDLDRTAELFKRLGAGPTTATLSRTLAERRRDHLYLHRETRGIPQPVALAPGDIWDGRFRVRSATSDLVAPLGLERASALGKDIGIAPHSLVIAALAAEPVSDGNGGPFERDVSPWALFLPEFDIAPNDAAARLFGAPLTPSWPWARHNGA